MFGKCLICSRLIISTTSGNSSITMRPKSPDTLHIYPRLASMVGGILSAMKASIPVLLGLLVEECGKDKKSTNTNSGNNTPEKSVKKEEK